MVVGFTITYQYLSPPSCMFNSFPWRGVQDTTLCAINNISVISISWWSVLFSGGNLHTWRKQKKLATSYLYTLSHKVVIVNRTRTNIAMAKEKKGETTIYNDLQNITHQTKD
jgi:hypothetical protein